MQINELSQEEVIIGHLEVVTTGMIKDLQINNAYSSWKNTPKGLLFIKDKKTQFYQGINM